MSNARAAGRLLVSGITAVVMVGSAGVTTPPTAIAKSGPETADEFTTASLAVQNEVVALAKTYIEARTSRLLSDNRGRAIAAVQGQAVSMAESQQRVAQAVDAFLETDRQLLARQKQRWISAETRVVPIDVWQAADGTVVAKVNEKTRLFFDRKLDPEAPEDSAQSVDRVFVFTSAAGKWQIAALRPASDASTVAINDAPRAVTEAAVVGFSPTINVPEYNYGTDGPLSAGDTAEDQAPEPVVELPEAEAPADGTPVGDDPKDPAGIGAAAQKQQAGYCYTCMVTYAYQYWDIYNTSYRALDNDCTNFISQALRSGSWAYDLGWYKNNSNWWYNRLNSTYSWRAAHNWSRFASKRVTWLRSAWSLLRSDILLEDWDSNGNISHAMIVTQKTSSMVYLTYHTNDSKNTPLSIVISHNPGTTYYAART